MANENLSNICPEKKKYVGNNALGKPVCVSTIRYRDPEKQAAYEKKLEDEKSGNDNLLKKYWWVLAAIGVFLVISND